MSDAPLRLALLGPVETRLDGIRSPLRRPKAQALLVMLAGHDHRVVANDQLIDGIWGIHAPRSAVTALRNLVLHTRQLLATPGREIVTAPHGGYRLAVDCETDTATVEYHWRTAEYALSAGHRAEAARAIDSALRLWRGDPLAGVPGPWAEAERARWREMQRGLREMSIDIASVTGDSQRAIAEATALLALHPHCERVCGLLMVALARAGRRSDALAVYRAMRGRLGRELGLEPTAALSDLNYRILSDDPVLPSHWSIRVSDPLPVPGR
ncbi:AfsR/SARP family transcriptional regulator [Nocardia sp. NPDC004260]